MSQKMRILLVTLVILVAVEARAQNWENVYNPGFGNGRLNNHGFGVPWVQPFQQDYLQNIAFGSNVEWVCRNSKTNDVMIIAADSLQQIPNRGPWHWQNLPPGHHRHQHDGRHWIQPIIIVQGGNKDNNNEEGSQTPLPNTTPKTHNNDDQPQTTPQNHGGEGLIDVRFGTNNS